MSEFQEKIFYEGVRFNVISVTRGWVVKFPGKKLYVTLKWPLIGGPPTPVLGEPLWRGVSQRPSREGLYAWIRRVRTLRSGTSQSPSRTTSDGSNRLQCHLQERYDTQSVISDYTNTMDALRVPQNKTGKTEHKNRVFS